MFEVHFSHDRNGYCIYFNDGNGITIEFMEGAFDSEIHAQMEVDSLNTEMKKCT